VPEKKTFHRGDGGKQKTTGWVFCCWRGGGRVNTNRGAMKEIGQVKVHALRNRLKRLVGKKT